MSIENGNIFPPVTSVPTLEAVTTVGKTTDQGIQIVDGSGNVLVDLTAAGQVFVKNAAGTTRLLLNPASMTFTDPAGSLSQGVAAGAGSFAALWRKQSGTVAYLSDIPAGASTLQAVTTAGKTTTQGMQIVDGSGNVLVDLTAAGQLFVKDTAGTTTLLVNPAALTFTDPAGSLSQGVAAGAGAFTALWRKQSGTVAYLSDITTTRAVPFTTVSGVLYNVLSTDQIVYMLASSGCIINLPAGVPVQGYIFTIKNISTSRTLTLMPPAGSFIDFINTGTVVNQLQSVQVQSVGGQYFIISAS